MNLPTSVTMSAPLFDTIEADEPDYERRTSAPTYNNTSSTQTNSNARPAQQMASSQEDAESGVFIRVPGVGVREGLPVGVFKALREYSDRCVFHNHCRSFNETDYFTSLRILLSSSASTSFGQPQSLSISSVDSSSQIMFSL